MIRDDQQPGEGWGETQADVGQALRRANAYLSETLDVDVDVDAGLANLRERTTQAEKRPPDPHMRLLARLFALMTVAVGAPFMLDLVSGRTLSILDLLFVAAAILNALLALIFVVTARTSEIFDGWVRGRPRQPESSVVRTPKDLQSRQQ